ncbi:MAG TPA: DNA polymerase III subunit delta [Elusimicrobia bacterium]|nr:MAG: DNA polymerase III subunit delta [Elusimicrobia bacterium RIFOXYA12_FULL_49_49]OGS09964.1 MAG: DNA polymerase III subunit delta [Elusimicrobia bacterium RIFOXYA1_FULL_47_7]OGS10989.1 MAG: DNA polymerase III subunit delta [Elusimicrobia bacterium RIFOXYB1_FULL_48_9]OGS15175.1 MAG: DNA polymerase III subunit delta [Elusimicrobia bacterium RIFOXYA2_FULL_47_53]OGS29795.1 MAG: DNA polymerase III subunit delta [Elusimicrobia bacterium RIFOXYB2_FULL_46_23]HBU70278.1 DNA polymerase III subunit
MPNIKPQDFYGQLKKKQFQPVYLIAGEETYLVDEAVNAVEKAVNTDDLNKEVFFAPDFSVDTLLMAAQTLPFLSDRRLLIVKNAERLKAADSSKLADFLKMPSTACCMVLIWNERPAKGDKSSKLFEAAGAAGAIVEFRALYDRELPVWVAQKVKSHSKTISAHAIDYLIAESGNNLLELENEIEKLVLFSGKSKEISLEAVEKISGHTKQKNLNQLSEAVESKSTAAALKIVDGLLEEGEIPLRMLATLNRVFRRLLTAKSLMLENGKDDADIRAELRLHQYFDRFFFSNLSKYSLAELNQSIETILRADLELKTSSRPEQFVFEELILSLTGKNKKAAVI